MPETLPVRTPGTDWLVARMMPFRFDNFRTDGPRGRGGVVMADTTRGWRRAQHDRLGQQRPRAAAQDFCQGIAEGPWLGELDDITVGHGVSLLHWRSGGVEHHHDTPPYPIMPSPTSGHSSQIDQQFPKPVTRQRVDARSRLVEDQH